VFKKNLIGYCKRVKKYNCCRRDVYSSKQNSSWTLHPRYISVFLIDCQQKSRTEIYHFIVIVK